MTRGLYTAYTGMLAQQYRMDTISNNLANVNTAGFKKQNVVFESFQDVLMLKLDDPEQIGANRIGKTNFGVKVGNTYTDFEQGNFLQTDNPLNVAIQGNGMIAVGKYDAQGNLTTRYTRDGSFGLNANGNLVTKDGYFVLGEDGPITLESSNISINNQGEILRNGEVVAKLQVTDFENKDTLVKIGGGVYMTTEATALKTFEGSVLQGGVESSNVNTVNEMVNMINIMRTYETSQKVISTYDDTIGKAVNDVGRL